MIRNTDWKGDDAMRITSSYGMKLTGDSDVLKTSLDIYRDALQMLIPIINDNWDTLSKYEFANQKYNCIEKWIHNAKNNQAVYDFDKQFPKFPTYLRRSAVAQALGIVSSYRSNLANWEKDPKGQAPQLSFTHYAYPAYYKNNLFRNFDPIRQTVELKVFKNGDWVYEVYQLKTSDCAYYQNHLIGKMDVETVAFPKTGQKTAVDANVDHFDTTEGQTSLKPELLDPLYAKVRTYQRQLTRKRKVNKDYQNSKSYQATRTKLQATYERICNVQNDLLHKFTTDLYRKYDTIVIEDLDVKGMQMQKKAKNLHRSLFGRFRQFMEYKAEKFGKTLIIADRYYPSTQRCSNCGYIKTGDEKITLSGNQKHGTKHNEYVCYNCGYEDDRDHNAVLNLLALA